MLTSLNEVVHGSVSARTPQQRCQTLGLRLPVMARVIPGVITYKPSYIEYCRMYMNVYIIRCISNYMNLGS